MKKILSIFALLMTIVIGAKAASVDDLATISANYTLIGETVNNASALEKGTLYDSNRIISLGGSGYSTQKGSQTIGGVSRLNCLQIKSGRQIAFKVSGACTLKLYGEVNSGRSWRVGSTSAGDEYGSSEEGVHVYSITGASTVYINASSDLYLAGFEIVFPAVGPTITTQPQSAVYATGDPIAALTVEATASAGDLEYQWYTCDDAVKTNAAAIDGATSASYTPTVAGFYYVNVADAKGNLDSDVAQITISAASAPTINVTGAPASDVLVGTEVILTAETTGTPTPTVTWYDGVTDEEIATGATYTVPTNVAGTFSFYAVASNGVEPDATSDVVTLTVTNPDKHVTGNVYYISEDEVVVAGEKIYADDITATIVNYSGAAPTADNSLSGINPNYVAQITGSNNGWGPEFVATKDGTLSVGVIINGGKKFTLTNVTSFDYNGVQDEGSNTTSANAGTNESNTWTPAKKQWTVLTFDVVAGTTYKLSVGGSKMGFYGFEFTPAATTETISIPEEGVLTYVTQNALDFSTQNGAFKAYVVTGLNAAKTSAQTAEVTQVPAGTPLLLKGAASSYDVDIIESAESVTNMLLASDGTVTGADDVFAYSKSKGKFVKVASTVTIPAGKAYLQIANAPGSLDIDFDGATAVDAIAEANEANAAAPVKVIKNGQLYIGNYNVAGQQVK